MALRHLAYARNMSPAPRAMKPLKLLLALLCLTAHLRPARATKPVIIIGAGLSGAKVAFELSRNNISFIILEANDRIGGRLRNARLGGSNGLLIEIGANWVQGYRRGEPFSDLLSEQVQFRNITTDFDAAYFVEDGRLVPDEVADPVWERAEEALAKTYRLQRTASRGGKLRFDMSIRSALLMAGGWEADTPIEKAAMRFLVDFEYALPGSAVSLHGLSTFYDPAAPESEDVFINDRRGFREVVKWHLRQAGVRNVKRSGEILHLNSPVRIIKHGERTAEVVLRNGRKFSGSAIVSTVSLGVLQEALFRKPKEESRLIFRPPLPFKKRLAISQLELADYLKVFIQFNLPVFGASDPLFLLPLECSEGGLITIQNLNKPGYYEGSNAVLVTSTAAFSRDLICMSDEMKLMKVLDFVSKAVGREVMRWEVESYLFPNFRQDEFFKGSYSARTPGVTEDTLRAFNKHLPSLFFAGEAHAGDLRGYVQGAWVSGAQTAEDVMKFLRME